MTSKLIGQISSAPLHLELETAELKNTHLIKKIRQSLESLQFTQALLFLVCEGLADSEDIGMFPPVLNHTSASICAAV